MEESFIKERRQIRYWGFTPEEFTKEFEDCAKTEVEDALNKLHVNVSSLSEQSNKTKEKLEAFRKVLLAKCEAPLKKMERLAQDLFSIPPNVVLPGEIAHDERITDEQLEELKKNVESLEKSYCEELYYLDLLKRYRDDLNKVDDARKCTEEWMKWLGSNNDTVVSNESSSSTRLIEEPSARAISKELMDDY